MEPIESTEGIDDGELLEKRLDSPIPSVRESAQRLKKLQEEMKGFEQTPSKPEIDAELQAKNDELKRQEDVMIQTFNEKNSETPQWKKEEALLKALTPNTYIKLEYRGLKGYSDTTNPEGAPFKYTLPNAVEANQVFVIAPDDPNLKDTLPANVARDPKVVFTEGISVALPNPGESGSELLIRQSSMKDIVRFIRMDDKDKPGEETVVVRYIHKPDEDVSFKINDLLSYNNVSLVKGNQEKYDEIFKITTEKRKILDVGSVIAAKGVASKLASKAATAKEAKETKTSVEAETFTQEEKEKIMKAAEMVEIIGAKINNAIIEDERSIGETVVAVGDEALAGAQKALDETVDQIGNIPDAVKAAADVLEGEKPAEAVPVALVPEAVPATSASAAPVAPAPVALVPEAVPATSASATPVAPAPVAPAPVSPAVPPVENQETKFQNVEDAVALMMELDQDLFPKVDFATLPMAASLSEIPYSLDEVQKVLDGEGKVAEKGGDGDWVVKETGKTELVGGKPIKKSRRKSRKKQRRKSRKKSRKKQRKSLKKTRKKQRKSRKNPLNSRKKSNKKSRK